MKNAMFTIKTLNSIAPAGLARLPAATFAVDNETDAPDGILVRSAKLHDTPLPDSLLAIGRAGAGVNNIPIDKCSAQGIVVFNTPGANSGAVAELTIGGLVLASRNVAAAVRWADGLKGQGDAVGGLVEKGKNQFVGPELRGKKLGVIGLGAIGVKVANAALHLGMEVLGYDPYISVEAAWSLSGEVQHCVNLSEILSQCDYITLHLPVNDQTKGFIGAAALSVCKHGIRILNFARGELVDNNALLPALASGRVAAYVTDFPCDQLLGVPGVTCIPHLGASTPESEENCAVMAADELADYLLNGNITNSVNLPAVSQARAGDRRICVIHKNEPGLISGITALTTAAALNIENMVNKSRGNMAYTMLDATGAVPDTLQQDLAAVPGIIRVRIL